MNPNETSSAPFLTPLGVPTVPWKLRDMILAIIVATVGVIVLNVIVLVISIAAGINLRDNGIVLGIFVLVQEVVIVGAAWLFSVVRHRAGWDTLGLRRFPVMLGCAFSVALLIASYITRICYVALALAAGIRLAPQQVLFRLDTSPGVFLLTFVGVAIVAPFAEEIFFRGFLYSGLRARWGIVVAMIISTLFFTALHFTLDQFIPIFILGVFLAWLYEYTGSLYPGIFLHIANNAISLIILALARAYNLPLQ